MPDDIQTRQLWRIAEMAAPVVTITIDGMQVQAHRGESVLAAMLSHGRIVRRHDSTDEPRAGFCLMGACQDCWVWFGPHDRGRACTTPVEDGMRILTRSPPEESRFG